MNFVLFILCILVLMVNYLQIGIDPCGFCGLDGCKIQLAVKGQNKKISCSCKYHYNEMSYGMAKKCTTNSPCTIHCPLCPPSSVHQKCLKDFKSGPRPPKWVVPLGG